MMNSNDKYNNLVYKIGRMKENSTIFPKDFALKASEFKSIINEIESDGLFKKGYNSISSDEYLFTGLTFAGRTFIENNSKKENMNMKNTEITYNQNIHIDGDNTGNLVNGTNNKIISEYELKFNSLIEAISNSSIHDKKDIIEILQSKKDDKEDLQIFLGKLLTRGAEVTSIAASAGTLLGLL